MDTSYLEKYYGKFCEEKRLASRHGQVEFTTTIKYIHDYLKDYENPQILEVGAGTGRYSCYLANEGYDVSAIELIKNKDKVSSLLNDVIGDICGVVSGSCGLAISITLASLLGTSKILIFCKNKQFC